MKYEMPVCTPESVGIPSKAIDRFLECLEGHYLPMHSVLIARHGKLCFENYWKPYDADKRHRLYSTSKSFVSAAIGILCGDGKIKLDDKITKFFPDKVPENLHPYTAAATIRDLLLMATPHLYEKCTYNPKAPDWADTYFQTPPTHLPGKIFSYDTTATTMLSIIVQRVTGKEFPEFLSDRFFAPAGMNTDLTCIETPCGHAWGGSGMLATPRDLMKFAGVFMNGGRTAMGEQIVPEWYVREATSRQIDNTLTSEEPDRAFGYGYQFWMNAHGFSCHGMGCQVAVCLPEQDFILVTTGDTQGIPASYHAVYDALWEEIYPYLVKGDSVPENPEENARVTKKWAEKEVFMIPGALKSSRMTEVSGITYKMDADNSLHIRNARFDFTEDGGKMTYENDTGYHTLPFKFGTYERTPFPETHYYGKRIGTPSGVGYDCLSGAVWAMEDTLHITVYSIDDHVGTLRINAVFNDGCLTLHMTKFAEWFFNEYLGFASGVEAGE